MRTKTERAKQRLEKSTEMCRRALLSSIPLFLLFFFVSPVNGATSNGNRFGPYVEVLKTPQPTNRALKIRKFAKIPDYNGGPAKIVGMTSWKKHLYVTTSVSGGYVWKINEITKEQVLWLDVKVAMKEKGRKLLVKEKYHGGVRGIAFHPRYRKVYISVVEERTKWIPKSRYLSIPTGKRADGDSVLLEFTYHTNGKPILSSLREVFRVGLRHLDHPIKQLAFKGSFLYISHGDGSVHSTLLGSGQNGMDALGKVLRINPIQVNGKPYTIPKRNPFVNTTGFLDEIYAYGFRNPHTLCVAMYAPHDIFVSDAGRDNVEEVNIVKAGLNYGWELREGPFVNLQKGGGIKRGVQSLPDDDEKYNFTYPNIALGHYGKEGWGFSEAKQAIAGGCPIDNGSGFNGLYLFTNFPSDGQMFFSKSYEMRYRTVTKGHPNVLKSARMYRLTVLYDRTGSGNYTKYDDMRQVIRLDSTKGTNKNRADTRIGRGYLGQVYISSKQNGIIYEVLNSFPKKSS